VIDISGSMSGHEAAYPTGASVQALVNYICGQRTGCRFGAVMWCDQIPLPTNDMQSLSVYAGPTSFCTFVSSFPARYNTSTTAQIAAFDEAIDDLNDNSSPSARRFVVFVTDDYMGNSSHQAEHLALVQALDSAVGSTGGGVFVSLWESWQGNLYSYYSQGFTDDPLYPSLAVNGGFDPTNWYYSSPVEDRYLFTNLIARILQGQ